jgi:hypothetical protein
MNINFSLLLLPSLLSCNSPKVAFCIILLKNINAYQIVRLFVFLFINCFILTFAQAQTLEDVIRKMQNEGSRDAMNEASKTIVPAYSEEGKDRECQRLNSISDIQSEGKKVMKESENNEEAAGIISKASNRALLTNYENLEIFKKADKIYFDPVKAFNDLSAQACKEILSNKKSEIEKIEEIETVEDMIFEKKQCEMPKTISECQKTLHLTCEANHECNFGGIVKDSVATDMKFEFRNGVLTIGTIADNYWGGDCNAYDRITKFELKNIDQIKDFKIIEVGFDDYLLVSINGHVVYVGPDDGNKLEIIKKEQKMWLFTHHVYFVNNGINDNACERMTNRQLTKNIDIKKYLKEGMNEIFMRTIVAGHGEGWIKIAANQHCCSSWKEEWREECQ